MEEIPWRYGRLWLDMDGMVGRKCHSEAPAKNVISPQGEKRIIT